MSEQELFKLYMSNIIWILKCLGKTGPWNFRLCLWNITYMLGYMFIKQNMFIMVEIIIALILQMDFALKRLNSTNYWNVVNEL